MSRTRGLVLLAAALATVATLPSQAEAAKRPNIVVVTTDDQTLASLRPDTMPNVTRLLAGKGTTFTDAIVTTPLCCPSRATWITGQYAHNHGVTSNGLGYAALEDKANTLPVWLDRAGYKTAHVGKYLNGYEGAVGTPTEVAPGWNIWFTTLGSTRYYDYDVSANGRPRHFQEHDNDYVTRVINRKAKSLIGRAAPLRAPLYLQVDHRAPHTETGIETRGGCSGRTVPDPDDKQLYKREALPQPLSFNEADVSDKPGFVQSRIPIDVNRLKKLTKRYTCALASLRAVDRGVEKIVKALKDAGELDKTVIVFTSDNGYYYGEHRIPVGKIYPYEEGIRVPLIMRVPEQYRGGGERIAEIGAPVGNIDLAPTLVEMARANTCSGGGVCRVMDGRSLVGLLGGDDPTFPDNRALVTEYDFGGEGSGEDGLCRYSGVRVTGALYVEHTLASDPANGCDPAPVPELYNLADDPFELENLAGGASAGGLESGLAGRLDRLRNCAGIAGRDQPVEGQPFCE
jgi:N-acetylglucosamine-6-sulfatase